MSQKIVTSKEFRRNKRRLITMERDNYDRIIMLPRAGEKGVNKNWYEIAENSALIYYYEVCEPLGESVNFTNDVDSYYDRYEIGLVCMNGSNKVRLLLKRAELYESEADEGEYHVIKLKKKFTEAHLKRLRQKEFQRRKENNEIVKIEFVDPNLYIWLRETAEKLHKICNDHFDRLARETNGTRMVILADRVLNNYQKLSVIKKGKEAERLKFWQVLYRDEKDLAYEIQTAIATKVMNASDGARICDYVRKALKKIKACHDNLARELRRKADATN